MTPKIVALLFHVLFLVQAFVVGWASGRRLLRRQIHKARAPFAAASPSLPDVADHDLIIELMARSYRAALLCGDEEQLASLRRLAKRDPRLLQRLTMLDTEQPLTTLRRAQA